VEPVGPLAGPPARQLSVAPDAGATVPLGPSHVVASVGTLGGGRERIMDHRTASRWSAVLLIVTGTLAACGGGATSAPATSAATPIGWRAPAVFSTPPDTGHTIEPVSANPSGLTAHGYVEQEYFASGTAYSFTGRSTPSDGKWTTAVAGSAPYRTRIIVRRPSDPASISAFTLWLSAIGSTDSTRATRAMASSCWRPCAMCLARWCCWISRCPDATASN